jgi:hypothetical protein
MIGDLEMFKAVRNCWRRRGSREGTFFLPPVIGPPDLGLKLKFQGGISYWFRPFRGLTYPINEPRPRESFSY